MKKLLTLVITCGLILGVSGCSTCPEPQQGDSDKIIITAPELE